MKIEWRWSGLLWWKKLGRENAGIEPTNWITHRMRGLGTWLQGGASCLYWKASMIHTSMWLELLVFPWSSKPSPAVFPSLPTPWQGFSTRLKGSRRQQFPAQPLKKCRVEQEVPCAKPSPKRPSLQLNARGAVLTPGGLFLVRSMVSDLEVTPADPVEEWNRVTHWCRKGEPGSEYLMD